MTDTTEFEAVSITMCLGTSDAMNARSCSVLCKCNDGDTFADAKSTTTVGAQQDPQRPRALVSPPPRPEHHNACSYSNQRSASEASHDAHTVLHPDPRSAAPLDGNPSMWS